MAAADLKIEEKQADHSSYGDFEHNDKIHEHTAHAIHELAEKDHPATDR
jgi:hypothetical protein